jgi:hypothetical protein
MTHRLPQLRAAHWNVYRHRGSDDSRLAGRLLSTDDAAAPRLSPFRLCLGESLSAFVAGAEHASEHVAFTAAADALSVGEVWAATLTFGMRLTLRCIADRAPLVIIGAICQRVSQAQFRVTVVADGSFGRAAVADDVLRWRGMVVAAGGANGVSVGAVPLCARLRKMHELLLDWDARGDRAVVGAGLGPITARVAPVSAAAATVPFPFGHIRLSVARPISGVVPADAAIGGDAHGAAWTELAPDAAGEHLLIAEAVASPPYRPFVARASAHIPPFRVVDAAGGM